MANTLTGLLMYCAHTVIPLRHGDEGKLEKTAVECVYVAMILFCSVEVLAWGICNAATHSIHHFVPLRIMYNVNQLTVVARNESTSIWMGILHMAVIWFNEVPQDTTSQEKIEKSTVRDIAKKWIETHNAKQLRIDTKHGDVASQNASKIKNSNEEDNERDMLWDVMVEKTTQNPDNKDDAECLQILECLHKPAHGLTSISNNDHQNTDVDSLRQEMEQIIEYSESRNAMIALLNKCCILYNKTTNTQEETKLLFLIKQINEKIDENDKPMKYVVDCIIDDAFRLKEYSKQILNMLGGDYIHIFEILREKEENINQDVGELKEYQITTYIIYRIVELIQYDSIQDNNIMNEIKQCIQVVNQRNGTNFTRISANSIVRNEMKNLCKHPNLIPEDPYNVFWWWVLDKNFKEVMIDLTSNSTLHNAILLIYKNKQDLS